MVLELPEALLNVSYIYPLYNGGETTMDTRLLNTPAIHAVAAFYGNRITHSDTAC